MFSKDMDKSIVSPFFDSRCTVDVSACHHHLIISYLSKRPLIECCCSSVASVKVNYYVYEMIILFIAFFGRVIAELLIECELARFLGLLIILQSILVAYFS